MTDCKWCKKPLPDGAQLCETCRLAQGGSQCKLCKAPLWPQSVRCSACGNYQGWRRIVNRSTAVPTLLGALIGLVGTGVLPAWNYYRERDSHTVVKVTGCDANQIFLKVWNTGRKPSVLMGYRLKFDQTPAAANKEQPLEPTGDTTESVIESKAKAETIKLSVPVGQSTVIAGSLPDRPWWKGARVTLEVDVRESDDPPGQTHTVRDVIVAEQIANFLPRIQS